MLSFCFFLNDPLHPDIYTLSLHDALPIYYLIVNATLKNTGDDFTASRLDWAIRNIDGFLIDVADCPIKAARSEIRSEEHTSELQSHSDLVCRLLLEKKKKIKKNE